MAKLPTAWRFGRRADDSVTPDARAGEGQLHSSNGHAGTGAPQEPTGIGDAEAAVPEQALVLAGGGPDVSVWRNRPFLQLWAAQAITQTAHNALWYALMVLVEEESHSTTQMGVTILTVVIPSVLFGVVAGVLVDHWEKRRVLIASNAIRAVLMLGFVLTERWLPGLFALSFVFSTVTQFFAPAETALIPELVHRRRLMQANSLFHITFISSQLAGLVLVGPLIVKLFGVTTFFLVVGGALALSALLVWPLPEAPPTMQATGEEGRRLWRRLRHDVRELWAFLRSDKQVSWAMLHLTLGSTLTLVVAMLAPGFVVRVLNTPPQDMVYIMAPAGVGMLAAALSLQHLAARAPKDALIHFGFAAVGVSLLLVGILPPLWQLVPFTRDAAGAADIASLRIAVMATTLAAGVGFACIIVPAQTILQERAPAAGRGRIFSVQLMLGSVASVLPLLFIGGIADAVGTTWVFAGLGVALIAFLVYLERNVSPQLLGRRAEDRPGPEAGTPAA